MQVEHFSPPILTLKHLSAFSHLFRFRCEFLQRRHEGKAEKTSKDTKGSQFRAAELFRSMLRDTGRRRKANWASKKALRTVKRKKFASKSAGGNKEGLEKALEGRQAHKKAFPAVLADV